MQVNELYHETTQVVLQKWKPVQINSSWNPLAGTHRKQRSAIELYAFRKELCVESEEVPLH